MSRPDKLIRRCPLQFAFLLLIHFTVPSILHEAYAQTLPTKRETQDALRIVSAFLGNETGAAWLAELAQNQETVPIITDRLMEAVLGATEKNGTVWQAADTIRSALAAQSRQETKLTPSPKWETDDWTDIITDMEKQDDVICLYTKETKEKKSSDWQKLLSNLSPSYTVHLALDNGNEYVICLKIIDVPSTQPSQTPQTTLLPVENSSITDSISTITQVTQSPKEQLLESTEASTQPFMLQDSTTSEMTPVTKSLIEYLTSSIREDESGTTKNENSDEENSNDDCKGKSAQDNDSEDLRALHDRDCSGKSNGTEAIERPLVPIIISYNIKPHTSLTSELRLPVDEYLSWLSSFPNSVYRTSSDSETFSPNAFNTEKCTRNVRPILKTQPSTVSDYPRIFNIGKRNRHELESNNVNSEYPPQIPSMLFNLASKSGTSFQLNPTRLQVESLPIFSQSMQENSKPSEYAHSKISPFSIEPSASVVPPNVLKVRGPFVYRVSIARMKKIKFY